MSIFYPFRENQKAGPIESLLKYGILLLMDNTTRYLTYFDHLKNDQSDARIIENTTRLMSYSHTVKRFFQRFSWPLVWICKTAMRELFVWRHRINQPVMILLNGAGLGTLLTPGGINGCYHHRGRSELTFRAFKEFGDQRPPFEKFRAKAAYYYLMCIGFFLYEAFKEDVCGDIFPPSSYPQTLRPTVIDIGAKLVRGGNRAICCP